MGNYKGFTRVKLRKPERSKFDLSHEKKLSTRMGKLVPVFCAETLPNDTFRVNTEVMLRLAPLLAPIYHRVNVFVHFFYVPMRLLYKDWEKMITNGRLGTETPPVVPTIVISQVLDSGLDLLDKGSLADYLGINPIPDSASAAWTGGEEERRISAFPFAAYYKVWYDYYRDRNYVDDNELLPLASGNFVDDPVFTQLMELRTRAWQHDYFTSALPWTQRGTDVLVPFSAIPTYREQGIVISASGNPVTGDGVMEFADDLNPGGLIADGGSPLAANIDNIESITNGTTTINDLRQAIVLQQWYERNAVAGSRYPESIMAHFNRRTSDGRLQRAEYLGGGRVNVKISEVMTTAWSQDSEANAIPPANMTGRGATYSNQNYFKYNCEEHGFVIGIMSVMPTSAYMQGMPRMFQMRNNFLDWPWPSFAHLGEQPVYKYEIYSDPDTVPDGSEVMEAPVFGYQSRYADWKYMYSSAHGDFRDSLDFWHLDRKFAAAPTLGNEFVTFEDALQDRVFAVAESDTLWCYIHNNASVVRSLPYFGTPML